LGGQKGKKKNVLAPCVQKKRKERAKRFIPIPWGRKKKRGKKGGGGKGKRNHYSWEPEH